MGFKLSESVPIFCIVLLPSKEDYELQKELEKEQKNTTETKKNDKKKGDNKEKSEEKKEEKVKDIVVELNNIEDRIVRLTPNSSDLGSAIITFGCEIHFHVGLIADGLQTFRISTHFLHRVTA